MRLKHVTPYYTIVYFFLSSGIMDSILFLFEKGYPHALGDVGSWLLLLPSINSFNKTEAVTFLFLKWRWTSFNDQCLSTRRIIKFSAIAVWNVVMFKAKYFAKRFISNIKPTHNKWSLVTKFPFYGCQYKRRIGTDATFMSLLRFGIPFKYLTAFLQSGNT